MPATKRASEETSKPVAKTTAKTSARAAEKVVETAQPVPAETDQLKARSAGSARKPSKTALSPAEVTPLALLTPSKPARRRRSGAAKPRKLKGATTTWPFPTGSRP